MNSIIVITEFIIYVLVYMLTPGLILMEGLSVEFKKKAEQYTVAFFCGMGLLIAEFILFSVIGINKAIIFINPILLITVTIIKRNHIQDFIKENISIKHIDEFVFFIVTFIILLIFSYYSFGRRFNLANGIAYNIHPDTLYAVAMSGELSHSFPMQHFIWAGEPFPYHCFKQSVFAIFEIITGIEAYTIYAYTLVLFNCFVSAIAITALVNQNNRLLWHRILLWILVFAGGYSCRYLIKGADFTSGIINYFVTDQNGEGIAYAGLVACLLAFVYCVSKSNVGSFITLLLVVFATAGIKSVITLSFVMAVCGTWVIKLFFEKKINKRFTVLTLCVLISYTIVFLFIIDGLANTGTKEGLSISIMNSYANSGVCSILKNMGISGRAHIIGYVLLLPAVGGPLVILAVERFCTEAIIGFKEKKVSNPDVYIALALVIIGSCGYVFTFQRSFSHLQFTIAVAVALVWLVGKYFDNSFYGKKTFVGIVLGISIVWGCFLSFNEVKGLITSESEREKNVPVEETYNSITEEEINAMKWIRENTPVDAVVAIDRQFLSENNDPTWVSARYYYYNAFMERRAYIAGSFYALPEDVDVEKRYKNNLSLYASTDGVLEDKLNEYGIDYIVVTKWLGTEFSPGNARVTSVFENNSITVYKSEL